MPLLPNPSSDRKSQAVSGSMDVTQAGSRAMFLCQRNSIDRGCETSDGCGQWSEEKLSFTAPPDRSLGEGGLGRRDFGHDTFTDADGNATRADFTIACNKLDHRVLISLHHASLTRLPPFEE